ncbi:hypothetical protein MHYP_G00018640 [Metynnis hypsauchen]
MGEGGVEGLTGPLESAPCVRFAALQADISERTRTRTVILQPGAAAVSENTMAGQKSNVLGQHFTEPAPGQAKCNICSELNDLLLQMMTKCFPCAFLYKAK